MNMMFERSADKGADKNPPDMIPVSSLEEVAIHFKNNDDQYRYEYFLVEKKIRIQIFS